MWANFMEINKKNCVVQRVEQTILLEIKFNSIRRVDYSSNLCVNLGNSDVVLETDNRLNNWK